MWVTNHIRLGFEIIPRILVVIESQECTNSGVVEWEGGIMIRIASEDGRRMEGDGRRHGETVGFLF